MCIPRGWSGPQPKHSAKWLGTGWPGRGAPAARGGSTAVGGGSVTARARELAGALSLTAADTIPRRTPPVEVTGHRLRRSSPIHGTLGAVGEHTADQGRTGPDPSPAPWSEGQDGLEPAYQERLRAPWPAWVFGTAMALSLGVAYGYAITVPWGVVTWLVTQAVVVWLLVRTAPLVRVDERVLRAGRARLPLQYVGRVRVLDAATARRLRGVDSDASAYLCVRSWVPRALVVEVADPEDPHPYWLVSARRPERVAAAVQARLGASGGPALPE